jgi:hypothetical protein
VYSVYGDESHDELYERTFAVSGILGDQKQWDSVREAWHLRTGGRVFHAAQCETDKGEFENSSHQDNLKLYKDLTAILCASNLWGWAAAMSLENHKQNFPAALEHQPYYFCSRWVIEHFADLAELLIPRGEIKFTFDHNIETEFNAAAQYRYLLTLPELKGRHLLADEIAFATRKQIGIQAADLVAREAMKHLDNEITGAGRPKRKSLNALQESGRFKFRLYTRSFFDGLHQFAVQTLGKHRMDDYDAWRAPLKLPDTYESRIRYHLYLNAINDRGDNIQS